MRLLVCVLFVHHIPLMFSFKVDMFDQVLNKIKKTNVSCLADSRRSNLQALPSDMKKIGKQTQGHVNLTPTCRVNSYYLVFETTARFRTYFIAAPLQEISLYFFFMFLARNSKSQHKCAKSKLCFPYHSRCFFPLSLRC